KVGDRYRYHDAARNQDLDRPNAGSQGFGGIGGGSGPLAGGEMSVRVFGTTLEGGSPGLAEFPTLSATHGNQIATALLHWANGDHADHEGSALHWDLQASERLAPRFFRDPTPPLGAAIDSSSHESGSELSASALRTFG